MRVCHNRYAYAEGDDCAAHRSASIFYFISTIAAMVVLGSTILLFFCCIFFKRRGIAERLRSVTSATSPVMYVWPGPADETPQPAAPAEAHHGSRKSEPVSCVIMAGEDHPTHLAKPLPREHSKVEELEQSRRTLP